MAYKITDDCISCGACEAECPVNAILDKEEAEQMQQMVRGASLTHRRTFYKLLEEKL